MKKLFLILLAAVLLTACAAPQKAEHPDWSPDWFAFDDVVAAETPEGFVLNESNDVLSIAGLYYATWTAGEGEPITNAQGREAMLYDAQIYMLLKECESAEAAKADIDDWIRREAGAYETEQGALTVKGTAYTTLRLIRPAGENPYDGGAAAFAVVGSNAISVELLCRERWDGDAAETLERFLNGLHD